MLVKGLVLGGTVKIHVNGLFSEEIELDRGVCQGCPLAPLLFALTTQPLLAFLHEECLQGRMMGIHVFDSLSIYERLFIDDMGFLIPATSECFKQVEDCISLYKLAFGEKLNIQKSTIIPIGLQSIPQWLVTKDVSSYLREVSLITLGHLLVIICQLRRFRNFISIGFVKEFPIGRGDIFYLLER